MKGLKGLAAAAMVSAAVLLAGCGSNTMLEEYSFGYVQLKAGNSEVYVMTPFDLAHVNRQDGEGMMYINNDKHINVVAVSETAGETTPVAMADKYVAMLKQTPDVSESANEDYRSRRERTQGYCRRRLLYGAFERPAGEAHRAEFLL